MLNTVIMKPIKVMSPPEISTTVHGVNLPLVRRAILSYPDIIEEQGHNLDYLYGIGTEKGTNSMSIENNRF